MNLNIIVTIMHVRNCTGIEERHERGNIYVQLIEVYMKAVTLKNQTLLPTLLRIHFQQIKLKISPITLYQGAQIFLYQTNKQLDSQAGVDSTVFVCVGGGGGGVYTGILTDTMGTNIITDAVNTRVHQCSYSCWYN